MNASTSFDFDFSQSISADRRKQHSRDMVRIRRNAEALMLSHRGVVNVGPHEDVEELAAEVGLKAHDFCAFDVRIGQRRACVVCVPSRLWHKPHVMAVFHQLKLAGQEHGYKIVLVPQAFVQRQPRLNNVNLISGTANHWISPTDRMAILAHLIEEDSASLYELSGLVKHSDPISSVLHLVTTGALDLDLNAQITPHSMVRISPSQ